MDMHESWNYKLHETGVSSEPDYHKYWVNKFVFVLLRPVSKNISQVLS